MTTMDNVESALATFNLTREKSDGQQCNNGNNVNQRKKAITCNFCKKAGHIARFCYAKKRSKSSNPKASHNGQNQNLPNSGSANFSAFVVSENGSSSTVESANLAEKPNKHDWLCELDDRYCWILDSGASRHISCRREWFGKLDTGGKAELVYLSDETQLKVEGR